MLKLQCQRDKSPRSRLCKVYGALSSFPVLAGPGPKLWKDVELCQSAILDAWSPVPGPWGSWFCKVLDTLGSGAYLEEVGHWGVFGSYTPSLQPLAPLHCPPQGQLYHEFKHHPLVSWSHQLNKPSHFSLCVLVISSHDAEVTRIIFKYHLG